MVSNRRGAGDVARYALGLFADPALASEILALPHVFPAVPEREMVAIRTDASSADAAIARALALAVMGIEAKVELTNE